MPKFDYIGARNAGWTDNQIASYLNEQKQKGVDLYIDKEEYHPVKTAEQQSLISKLTNFAGDVGKSIAKPFAELGTAAVNLGEGTYKTITGDLRGANIALNKSRDIPLLGETKPAFTGAETFGEASKKAAGYAAELGSWYVGGGGAKAALGETVKGAIIGSGLKGAATGAAAGALSQGGQTLREGGTLGETALSATQGAVGGGILGGAAGTIGAGAAAGAKAVFQPAESRLKEKVVEAIDKGIKPYFSGVKTPAKAQEYYKKAEDAFKTIIKYKSEITGEDDIKVAKLPENRRELLEAIGNAKQKIYSAYNQISTEAGEQGAKYNPTNVLKSLDEVATSKKYNPSIRSYAENLKKDIEELAGETPDVIEARIQDLNSSLGGFYEGRINKAQVQVDASVAAKMREELDALINQTTGANYQAIKNEYGALKTIEKDVARQVMLEARKNPKGLPDLLDVFSGGDLMAGIVTHNPALILKSAAQKGITEYFKILNNPNRYIKNIFSELEKTTTNTLKK